MSRTDNKTLNLLNSVIDGWMAEYRFDDIRQFRFDFAHPKLMIAVEIEGGVWSYGAHVRGTGYIKDMEKYNLAIVLGWKILRYTTNQNKKMISDVRKLLVMV